MQFEPLLSDNVNKKLQRKLHNYSKYDIMKKDTTY